MDQSELKYAIRVDERAFFIRFYCWLYQADRSKVNFCKLFWAYVFAAPALCLRGLLGLGVLAGKGLVLLGRGIALAARPIPHVLDPIFWLLDTSVSHRDARLKRHREAAERERQERLANPPEPKPEPEPNREIMQRSLNLVEHGGTVAIMKGKTAIESTRATRVAAGRTIARVATHVGEVASIPAIGRTLLVCAAGLSVAGISISLYYLAPTIALLFTSLGSGMGAAAQGTGEVTSTAAYAVTHSQYSLWTLLGITGIILTVTLIMGALAIGLPYMFVKYFLEPVSRPVVKAGEGGAKVIGGGFRGFAQVMYLGYYAVKTSTCPRIEVEKRPDYAKTRRQEREVDLA